MNNKSSICLNMIVKNEKHIIKQTLDNICSYIDFSYWVISDTGSTDGTQEFIKEYFKEKNIPGELFQDEWHDFAYNRNLALEHGFDKSDYLFFFDADDLIHGNFKLPDKLSKDVYTFKFSQNFSYDRICLINNREKVGKYIGVLHELFNINKLNYTIEKVNGEYYFECKHLGDRSKNPDKYKKDGETLEIAFSNENTNLGLKYRYAYYCAQSYQDGGITEKSIEWYKKFLDLPADDQYKYCACINLGHNYKHINSNEESIYYYGLAYKYDSTRIEGITYLMDYYYNKNLHFIVSALWNKFKNYEILNPDHKIFLNIDRYKWFEWYNIVSGFYSDDFNGAYTSCKRSVINNYNTPNVLQNLIFYKKQYDNDNDNIVKEFLFNYIKNNNDVDNFNKYNEFIKNYSIEKYNLLYDHFNLNNIDKSSSYKSSNKILIYTGYMNFLWNDSILKDKSLGGSEKAIIYLSRCLPKNYEIFIAGDQLEEEIDNIKYVNHNNLQNLLNENTFHTVIVSRYVSFLKNFKNIKCGQLVLSAHDICFLGDNNDYIINQYNKYIDTCVCLTQWHKNIFIEKYNCLKDKFRVINNGINITELDKNTIDSSIKIKNKFIWTSVSTRGLLTLLKLWPELLKKIPDATLDISSYNDFPLHDCDTEILEIINKNSDSIKHHGKLANKELYKLISQAEFWLYTTNFQETSCITGMEMLMNEVICLYYPIAGLVDTIGDYGIKVESGNEIDTILNLSKERKKELINNGKEYALSCGWENRAEEWNKILGLNRKKWIFYYNNFTIETISQYINNQTFSCMNEYDIFISNNKDEIIKLQPNKLSFIFSLFDETILESIDNNVEVSLLQTEPLNLSTRLDPIVNFYKKYPNFKIYDYSKSNIKILSKYNINNCKYLSYNIQQYELNKLKTFLTENKNNRIYDFGFIYNWKSLPIDKQHIINPPRRRNVVDFLRKNGFKVNIIAGYGDDRDIELSKCKIILNIHGQINQNPKPTLDECSNIFEHIRCDRLLEAGFTVLSETSYELDKEFVDKYPNLKQIEYSDFFNIDEIVKYYNTYNRYNDLTEIKNIYDTLCLNKNPFDYDLNPIDIYEHLPTLYRYANECESILECGVRGAVSSWSFVYGLLNNNSDNKKLILNDIERCNIDTLLQKTKNINLDIEYKWINNLDLVLKENVDMTFIDTWHVGGHLKKELAKFSKLTNKYIIMHDTTIDEFTSEAIRANLTEEKIKELAISSSMSIDDIKMGLWPAIEDFLKNNNEWNLHERFTNNNGLTILKKVSNKPKIIDCFTFYNELDLLTYRLNILNDVVDYFVLVEATHTHSGKEKPLFYQENKHLFEKFQHKIINITVDDFSYKYPNINIEKQEQWINERFQRDCISRGLNKLSLHNNDVITITDADEIPNPRLLKQIKNNDIVIDINILELDFYYYNLESKIGYQWHHSKILTFKKYNELNIGCDKIRFYRCPIIKNGGWHLSYFGNEKFIKNKLENFAHQEYNKAEFTNENIIKENIKNKNDLFNRPSNIYNIINIPIEENKNLPPDYDIYLKSFYKIQLRQTNKNIGFFIRQFSERGTEVAVYDYAHYNEKILQNKSYIIYFSDNTQKKYGFSDIKDSFIKFNSRFEMIEINDITDMKHIIKKYKLDFFYTLTSGRKDIYKFDNKYIWDKCKTIKHCVFNTLSPEGDYNLSISNYLNKKNNTNYTVLPHIVDLPNTDTDLRDELNIPNNAIVLGRYGGFNQFDLKIAHNAIEKFLNINKHNNIYFLFMNTYEFYHHQNIIYLDKNIDLVYKTKFINTCDAMIHARSDGETFGLAIAEFSIKNKPIITCPCGDLEHILLLKDKAIIYNNTEELIDIFSNIKKLISQRSCWNCYREYTPKKIMNIFDNILSNYKLETNIVTFNNIEFKFFKHDNLAKSSIALNIPWESHITKFVEYYNKYFPIQNIIDIGANFGYHSLLFSKYVKNKVFSFEPQEQNYNLLYFNINFNNIKNICSYKMGCGEENNTIKMPLIENYNNSINMGDFTPNIVNNHHFTYVKSIKLDDIDFPHIDIIKIDVQGWEKKVLKGSCNLLQHHKPILIIEFEELQLNKLNESCKNLIEYIRENNYYIFYLDYKYPSDHICVHNDKLNEFRNCFKSVISNHTQDNNINHNILYNINEKIII